MNSKAINTIIGEMSILPNVGMNFFTILMLGSQTLYKAVNIE